MAALGPYERKPQIAVAVSGGADSMAESSRMRGYFGIGVERIS